MTHTYHINGMTCNNCVARVKSELLKLGDVLQADVQLADPQATITMNKHIGTSALQDAVSKAGHYTITDADTAMHKEMNGQAAVADEEASYFPIYLIFAYITGATLLVEWISGGFDLMRWMPHFMAGFFLVFSFFKLLNLRGFAEGYQTYDIIAKAIPAWGYIYPFVELALGILFLTGLAPFDTNIVTLAVMGVSTIGVVQSLLKKTKFQCACLGTIIKVPLSKVTLFEDLLMVVMSAVMIVILL